ncbi:MAG: hypothetical protein AAFV25_27470 [Bacteroidota bacterium]
MTQSSFIGKAVVCSLLSILLLAACQKNQSIVETESPQLEDEGRFPNVDTRLWPYFQRYEEEGLARGFRIDLAARGITGVIADLEGEHVAGQCNYNFRSPNHVTVDLDFWNRSSDRFKEFIIFHELGHCHLLRDHREDSHSNGRCVSLMRSGLGECWDAYNTQTRQAYIDELFEPDNTNPL